MLFLLGMPFIYHFNHFIAFVYSRGENIKKRLFHICCWFVSMVSLLGLGYSIFFSGDGVRKVDEINPVVYFTLSIGIFSLLNVSSHLFVRFKNIKQKKEEFTPKIGFMFWAFLFSLYLIFTVIDHFSFWKDKSRVGMVNVSALKEMPETKDLVSDIRCDSAMLYVKKSLDNDSYEYRCPMVIFGFLYSRAPFTPWPNYTTGTSDKLSDAIRAIESGAIRLDKNN